MNIKTKLIIAGAGNFIDAIATFILIKYFGAVELNPIMAWLLQWPLFAIFVKILFINFILIYLNFTKRKKYINGLATFAAIIYGTMGLYYILFFIALFANGYIILL